MSQNCKPALSLPNCQRTLADVAFNPVDGSLYGVGADKHLIRINATTGVVTDVGALSGLD